MNTKKTNLLQVRIDETTKTELDAVLDQLGLTTSQAIILYIKQIIINQKIPFELKTKKAFDTSDISQTDQIKIQTQLISKYDEGESIPEFENKNKKKFVY
jgi:DNA-damage-inducible protein J